MATKPKNLKDVKNQIATQATVEGNTKTPPATKSKTPKPKSVTRIGPDDECSYDDVLRQETDDANACFEGGDVPK